MRTAWHKAPSTVAAAAATNSKCTESMADRERETACEEDGEVEKNMLKGRIRQMIHITHVERAHFTYTHTQCMCCMVDIFIHEKGIYIYTRYTCCFFPSSSSYSDSSCSYVPFIASRESENEAIYPKMNPIGVCRKNDLAQFTEKKTVFFKWTHTPHQRRMRARARVRERDMENCPKIKCLRMREKKSTKRSEQQWQRQHFRIPN